MNNHFFQTEKKVKIKLARDLVKHLKRGNPWIFKDALVEIPKNATGSLATLIDRNNDIVAKGFFDEGINLCFRKIALQHEKMNDELIIERLDLALKLRLGLFNEHLNAMRLINGEGDELPGIVVDLYHDIAVLKLDGEGSNLFWNKSAIAEYFKKQKYFKVRDFYFKKKNKDSEKGELLFGIGTDLKHKVFTEYDAKFITNIIDGAKTGFFLDQRENRKIIKSVARDLDVLNLFSYTGGFSIQAGLGGAKKVTSVDIAPEAIKLTEEIWSLNQINGEHIGVCADVFKFLADKKAAKIQWDLVITDPPSFAPNHDSREKAMAAYLEIYANSILLTKTHGLFAASSCTGHLSMEEFLDITKEAFSRAKRRGKVVVLSGQPQDHPFPLNLPQARYLKFALFQVFE
jgi:23S rRNA (cytosine1962-C5)-methyltransferase